MIKGAALAMIRWYKRNVSPSLPPGCRYQPTCSEYTHEAIEVHGVVKGIGLGVWRLMRCNPWSKGGIDRVPGTESSQEQVASSQRMASGPEQVTSGHKHVGKGA
jgi:putative membrane protein insertion efficiency factor